MIKCQSGIHPLYFTVGLFKCGLLLTLVLTLTLVSLVSLAAGFSVVKLWRAALRNDAKNGCEGDCGFSYQKAFPLLVLS